VRRTGRLTAGQQGALSRLWTRYGLEYTASRIDFRQLFGRDADTLLEIGFGNGETLVAQATQQPDWNFLGAEVHRPGIGHCLMLAEAAGLSNLRIVAQDAIDVLREQVPPESLARANLYFPDPWPKKRHHKRRIVQQAFLKLVAGRLRPAGSLHIATDWADYAQHIDELLAASALFRVQERRRHDGGDALDRETTRFERRGLRQGHEIFDWHLVKN
jgi:tRNA (guanine-N7-)-methyltransferase